jgi:hypothetical protein
MIHQLNNLEDFGPSFTREEIKKRGWSKEELIGILVSFLMKGTNISQKDNSNACSDGLDTARSKGLVEISNEITDLTIERIVAAFPVLVACLIHKKEELQQYILCKDIGDIPIYLKFSSGASLLLSEDELTNWILWAQAQDRIVNPTRHNPINVAKSARKQYDANVLSASKIKLIRDQLKREKEPRSDLSASERKKSANKETESSENGLDKIPLVFFFANMSAYQIFGCLFDNKSSFYNTRKSKYEITAMTVSAWELSNEKNNPRYKDFEPNSSDKDILSDLREIFRNI